MGRATGQRDLPARPHPRSAAAAQEPGLQPGFGTRLVTGIVAEVKLPIWKRSSACVQLWKRMVRVPTSRVTTGAGWLNAPPWLS